MGTSIKVTAGTLVYSRLGRDFIILEAMEFGKGAVFRVGIEYIYSLLMSFFRKGVIPRERFTSMLDFRDHWVMINLGEHGCMKLNSAISIHIEDYILFLPDTDKTAGRRACRSSHFPWRPPPKSKQLPLPTNLLAYRLVFLRKNILVNISMSVSTVIQRTCHPES